MYCFNHLENFAKHYVKSTLRQNHKKLIKIAKIAVQSRGFNKYIIMQKKNCMIMQ